MRWTANLAETLEKAQSFKSFSIYLLHYFDIIVDIHMPA
jgi:hypothetical protein